MTILYLLDSKPLPVEADAIETLEKSGPVGVRNLRHWYGETEHCDLVVSLDQGVLDAYTAKRYKAELIGTGAEPKKTRSRRK